MSEVKNEGLEVVDVRAIVTDAFISMMESALGMKAPDCAPPAFIQSAIDRAIDRINSEALAGYAVRDALLAELEAENEALNIWRDLALQFDSHRMAALWHLKRLVADSQSKSCAELFLSEPPLAAHEVVAERDQLRAELMALMTIKAQDGFERYQLADKFCEQRLVTDDHVRAIVVDAFASGYGFGIAADPVAKQDNEDLKRAWQAGHDTAWYGKNPAHERGYVPVAKQVVLPDADHSEDVRAMVADPSPAGVDGLEVVAWRIGFPNNAGYKVYEQRQPWAYEQYGVPSVIVYEVQELCRLSDAQAIIDGLRG